MRSLLPLLLCLACQTAPPAVPTPAQNLRVMSFNLRYGTANDGSNSWFLRKELLMEVIANEQPAVLGAQETLRFQLDEIEAVFPHLAELGVGRDDGEQAGEYSPILYDRERLQILEQGTFWLSDTPEQIASTSWGNSIPRICTWASLEDRTDGSRFHVFNTHWDHRSQPSRERSAQLILDRIASIAQGGAVLLLGDFNAGENNPAFRALLGDARVPLADTFRACHPKATEVGTFNGFKGTQDGEKIDAVLASPHWLVDSAAIVRTQRDGRYPSDHFPVLAVLRKGDRELP